MFIMLKTLIKYQQLIDPCIAGHLSTLDSGFRPMIWALPLRHSCTLVLENPPAAFPRT